MNFQTIALGHCASIRDNTVCIFPSDTDKCLIFFFLDNLSEILTSIIETCIYVFFLQTQTNVQQRFEREKRELEQAHVKIVKQLEAKLYETESSNKVSLLLNTH